MSYRDYQNTRDAVWKILIDLKIDRLPVDLNLICKQLGVRAISYGRAKNLIQARNLTETTERTDGLTFYADQLPVILFNETCIQGRIRFTIAHELGHLILLHVHPGQITMKNREPSPQDDPQETAANQFAARLLAPACVLWGRNLHTPEEVSEACHISYQAACFRAERMQILYQRNKFLTSPLEREVYRQFQSYIKG